VLDGRRTLPAEVTLVKVVETTGTPQSVVSVTIYEGRNRQVRRMCEAVGHPVIRLRRVRIGPIVDPEIRPGEFRDLSSKEIADLKKAAERTPPRQRPTRPTSNSQMQELPKGQRPTPKRSTQKK
jgi:16S rRNA U516 pseudouridylate synthase RsuA-like enzyme